MRILLVDDDTSVLQALLGVLKTLPGHDLKVAATGAKALENANAAGGVDVLITDVVMEPMDGFTLRDHVKAQFPNARTIFITGYDLTDYTEQTAGCQVLQKPVSPETLIAAVERELRPPAPQAVAAAVPRAVATSSASTPQAVSQPRAVAASGTAVTGHAASSPRIVAEEQLATETEPPLSPALPTVTEAPEAPAANGQTSAHAHPPETAEAEAQSTSMGLIGYMIGGYQIVSQLGEGRWGTVYAAVQTSINRPVGFRVLDP
ncbi:MAG: response regulator, partial [Chthoniobacteraceae bacterium]